MTGLFPHTADGGDAVEAIRELQRQMREIQERIDKIEWIISGKPETPKPEPNTITWLK